MLFESRLLQIAVLVSRKSKKTRLNSACCYFMRHNRNLSGEVRVRRITRRNRRIHDELPLVAEKFKEFLETSEVTP